MTFSSKLISLCFKNVRNFTKNYLSKTLYERNKSLLCNETVALEQSIIESLENVPISCKTSHDVKKKLFCMMRKRKLMQLILLHDIYMTSTCFILLSACTVYWGSDVIFKNAHYLIFPTRNHYFGNNISKDICVLPFLASLLGFPKSHKYTCRSLSMRFANRFF